MDDSFGHIDLTGIQIQLRREQLQRIEARQVASEESFVESCEEAFNPFAADKDKREKFKTLEQRSANAKTENAAKSSFTTDEAAEVAKQAEKENPELEAATLRRLFRSLNKSDPQGTILKKVLAYYPDAYLADEAMEQLAAMASGELQESIKKAREEHNKKQKKRIVAGRNIATTTREYAEKNLDSPSSLRQLYQDVTHNPREVLDLFEEFAGKYPFDKLDEVFSFLFHSLGSDMNSKGPSIEPAELQRLFTEVRTLQAILGVYRFFKGRIPLLTNYFQRHQLTAPQTLTFESLSKQFVKLAMERYPTSLRVMQLLKQLQMASELEGQIIILMQLRDAIRGLSPRIYRTEKHRQELLDAIIDALSELEDEMEEKEKDEE